jgi:hypothetical protein
MNRDASSEADPSPEGRGCKDSSLHPSPGASHHPLPSGEGFARNTFLTSTAHGVPKSHIARFEFLHFNSNKSKIPQNEISFAKSNAAPPEVRLPPFSERRVRPFHEGLDRQIPPGDKNRTTKKDSHFEVNRDEESCSGGERL